jgi:hypothetical protein
MLHHGLTRNRGKKCDNKYHRVVKDHRFTLSGRLIPGMSSNGGIGTTCMMMTPEALSGVNMFTRRSVPSIFRDAVALSFPCATFEKSAPRTNSPAAER